MFRQSLSADAPHASLLLGSDGKLKFRRRMTAGGTTLSHGPSAGSASAPRWVKITRQGQLFTAYNSVNGVAWTMVGPPTTIPMPANVGMGIWAPAEWRNWPRPGQIDRCDCLVAKRVGLS
jgi:hypothetical protein